MFSYKRAIARKACSHRRRCLLLLPWILLAGALLLGCSPDKPAAEVSVVYHFSSSTRGLMESTLKVVPTRHHISAVSTLADGSCLTEEVRMDAGGRVLEGNASLVTADGSRSRDVVFDAVSGAVDVTTARFHTRRPVPRDYPWAWTSLLRDANGASIATPLGAVIAMRAASASSALRWANSETFETHTIMADQVLVANEGSVTAVLGDDWVDLTDGIPTRMHLMAIDTYLQIDSIESAPAKSGLEAESVAAARSTSAANQRLSR